MKPEPTPERSEVLLIGGRSGVGKTSLAAELHHQLSARQVRHAVIEGDNLDLAWPPPWEHGLAERNLATIWQNYRALGYRRLIYTNTVSVLHSADLARAMGDEPVLRAVLLTANDDTARARLAGREIGAGLEVHVEKSSKRAAELGQQTPAWVQRLGTDGRTVGELGAQVLAWLGWT
ncbi:adenylyl-sulfate kinase [Deinococcus alpinitundrae]|uniref:adenylyl-sulfate kinase n=1 Tax=Deinococcus alpinitundrae TaxID=468913 RepID=UPI00137A136F|nr:adenylyl-sulfate kinase [Deinococcus alpinitundrae]